MPKTVYLADDEKNIRDLMKTFLENAGFTVSAFADGDALLAACEESLPDLVILDIMMPGTDGLTICSLLRQKNPALPMIIVSARDDPYDRVAGLSLGSDDYLVKPFLPLELVARVKAILRRFGDTPKQSSVLTFEGLEINLNNYSVKSNGEGVPCTPKEVEILYLLASHPGQVFGREQILESVWGIDFTGDSRTVDTHIKRIRQKIAYDSAPWSIQTIYGIGYKFEVS